jgi:hypothetical protein
VVREQPEFAFARAHPCHQALLALQQFVLPCEQLLLAARERLLPFQQRLGCRQCCVMAAVVAQHDLQARAAVRTGDVGGRQLQPGGSRAFALHPHLA